MLSVEERINGMVKILAESNMEIESPLSVKTGFVAVPPEILADSILELMKHADFDKVSIDLGCGNGGWMLIAAAAGFASYGVELNPFLIEHAQKNYELGIAAGFIDAATPCSWIVGDMIPLRFNTSYMKFRELHEKQKGNMPTGAMVEDSYSRLPISIATADIIYCWAWPTQSEFIFNMLEDEAKQDVFFIVPSYENYMKREHVGVFVENRLLLTPLSVIDGVYLGVRK